MVLFSQANIWSLVNILLSHILVPATIVISLMIVAMPRLAREVQNLLRLVKYAVILLVRSHCFPYPSALYSNFWEVVILIAIFS